MQYTQRLLNLSRIKIYGIISISLYPYFSSFGIINALFIFNANFHPILRIIAASQNI